MVDFGFAVIISLFIVYYLIVLIVERKIIQDPKDIIDKFLSVILLYAGVTLIYFSITGQTLLGTTQESIQIYVFIIGFIALLWTIPNLLKEFTFFQNYFDKRNTRLLKLKRTKRK